MSTPVLQHNSAPEVAPTRVALCRAWFATTVISAVFCVGVSLTMLVHHLATRSEAPLTSPRLVALKGKLLTAPNDKELKQQIREVDLDVRRAHFVKTRLKQTGGWLLLAGLVVLIASGREVARLREKPPQPAAAGDTSEALMRTAARARLTVLAMALLVTATIIWLALSFGSRLPDAPGEARKLLDRLAGLAPDSQETVPGPSQLAANWPRFLGPGGNAHTTNTVILTAVDPANGTGICWRTATDAPGFSSPVVWADRVFLSGGDATNRSVFCYNTTTGALLWQRPVQNVPGSPAKQPEIAEGTGFAASTMATDGARVYVIFGNGDLAAFKLDGTAAWSRNVGVPDNPYGHAQSLLTWQGRLIVPLDQSEEEKNRSRLFMIDGATGKSLWETVRSVPSSWATPITIDVAGGTQIITLGGSWVIAYDASRGTEVWRAECLSGEITPSPIFAGGFVLAVSPYEKMVAIRPDGKGDVTKTHIAWAYEENMPDISSPVSNGALVFAASSPGVLTCLEVKDGTKHWEHDFEFEVNATPAIGGDRLCLAGKKGLVVIVEAGPTFKELGRFDIGEEILASPAFGGGKMLLRTTKALYCFGAAATKVASPK